MPAKAKVVVSRKWHKPSVEAFVNHTEVGAQVELQDFIKALVEEVGNPTLIVSKDALQKKLEAAAETVLHEIKQATSKVV